MAKQTNTEERVQLSDLEAPERELTAEEQEKVAGGMMDNETCKETKDSGMMGCGTG